MVGTRVHGAAGARGNWQKHPVMTQPVHMAKKIRADGRVSPLCAKTPRAIDLKRASWTLQAGMVTCDRCKAVAAENMARVH